MKIKKLFRWIVPLLLLASAGVVVTNPGLVSNFRGQIVQTQQFLVIADANGNIPTDVAVCNVPLDALQQSSVTIINSNPKGICMGGLTIAGGPPILGDVNGFGLINIFQKFDSDLQGAVVNNILICQIPCSNPSAGELQTCHDLTSRGAPQSFSIQAHNSC